MPRFVILQHETPAGATRATHWDFMLEFDDGLRTWALAEAPCESRGIAAEALADHRKAYLEYEGPLSGDRGHVKQWDAGQFELMSASNVELHCELRGKRLCGTVVLKLSDDNGAERQRWMFLFRNK